MRELSKQRTSRLKLLIFMILLLILALIIGTFVIEEYGSSKLPVKESPDISSPSNNKPLESGNDQISSLEQFVRGIFSLSKEGKVPSVSFISGETEWKEVNEEWGKSDHVSETAKGRYEEYENHHVLSSQSHFSIRKTKGLLFSTITSFTFIFKISKTQRRLL